MASNPHYAVSTAVLSASSSVALIRAGSASKRAALATHKVHVPVAHCTMSDAPQCMVQAGTDTVAFAASSGSVVVLSLRGGAGSGARGEPALTSVTIEGAHEGACLGLAFVNLSLLSDVPSDCTHVLASCGEDGAVRMWQLRLPGAAAAAELKPATATLLAQLSFGSDRTKGGVWLSHMAAVPASVSSSAALLCVASGARVWLWPAGVAFTALGSSVPRVLEAHEPVDALQFDNGGALLAACNQGVCMWTSVCLAACFAKPTGAAEAAEAAAEAEVLEYDGWCQSMAVSPSAQWIATGCNDGTLRLWDIPREKQFGCSGYDGCPLRLGWSADGSILFSAAGNTVTCWPFAAEKQKSALRRGPDGKLPIVCLGHTAESWSADEKPEPQQPRIITALAACVGGVLSGGDDGVVRFHSLQEQHIKPGDKRRGIPHTTDAQWSLKGVASRGVLHLALLGADAGPGVAVTADGTGRVSAFQIPLSQHDA
jgi:WD40 repeat protein